MICNYISIFDYSSNIYHHRLTETLLHQTSSFWLKHTPNNGFSPLSTTITFCPQQSQIYLRNVKISIVLNRVLIPKTPALKTFIFQLQIQFANTSLPEEIWVRQNVQNCTRRICANFRFNLLNEKIFIFLIEQYCIMLWRLTNGM